MKAIGFVNGRVGDAVMATVAARQFKLQNPGSHLTFALGRQFGNVIDLFKGNPHIDALHVWDSTDDWPRDKDIQFIRDSVFDKVFNPLPRHTRFDWYNHLHYVEETCLMLGLGRPADLTCQLGYVPKKLPGLDKTITTSMFASGNQPYKTLNHAKMAGLMAGLADLGYQVIQVGSTDLPIPHTSHFNMGIFEAVDTICSARLHLTIDTAFAWVSSCYKRPLVGLYGLNYPDMLAGRQVSHNPVNPNATYLNTDLVDNLTIEAIIEAVESRLAAPYV